MVWPYNRNRREEVWATSGIGRRIESLQKRVHEHEQKISRERRKTKPDEGLISHWEAEIRAFRNGIEKANKRLGGNA
jgi:hypothetical protein